MYVMSPPRLTDCITNCITNHRPVLSSERAPQDEEQSNSTAKERKKKNVVMGPKVVPDTKTYRPTDRRSQHQLNLYLGASPKGCSILRHTELPSVVK
jgi:hypothetical protein